MIEYQDLIAKNSQYTSLLPSIDSANVFLLECEDTIYLENFALMLAKAILCTDTPRPCGKCQDCLKMSLVSHSDVHIYPKFSKGVVVDDVKDMLDRIYLAPLESDKQVFIFNSFSSATPQAQNKLLKILEEGPSNSYIILCVSAISKVLRTVQSRCYKTKLLPIPSDDLKKVLDISDNSALDRVLSLAGGSLTRAIRYAQDDDFQGIYDAVLSTICDMKDSRQVLAYSCMLGEKSEDLSIIFELFEIFFRYLLLVRLGREDFVEDKSCLERLRSVQQEYSPDAIDLILREIYKAREKLEFNCNKQTIIDSFLLYILEVKYLCRE